MSQNTQISWLSYDNENSNEPNDLRVDLKTMEPKATESPTLDETDDAVEASGEASAFFVEGEVEKDILERYKAMEQFEENYKTFQDKAMKDLHDKQKDLFVEGEEEASAPEPSLSGLEANSEPDLEPEPAKPSKNSFKDRLLRHREAPGDSFDTVFPSSEDLTKNLDLELPSLKRRLMEVREASLGSEEEEAPVEPSLELGEGATTHAFYPPLLNPEDLSPLKKQNPSKARLGASASKPPKGGFRRGFEQESNFPPLIDFEQLVQSDLGFKPQAKKATDSTFERLRRPLIRLFSVLLVVSSAVLLAFVAYLKRDALVLLWERMLYRDAPLVIRENIASDAGRSASPERRGPTKALEESLPPSDFKKATRYYIKWGMTLKTIARDVYGDPDHWPYLYFYNEASVNSLSRLVPVKDVIYLPPKDYIRNVPLAKLFLLLARRHGNTPTGRQYLNKAKQIDPVLVDRLIRRK